MASQIEYTPTCHLSFHQAKCPETTEESKEAETQGPTYNYTTYDYLNMQYDNYKANIEIKIPCGRVWVGEVVPDFYE